jgi:acetyltransferase-like isoleucine patch superfamily enzyme
MNIKQIKLLFAKIISIIIFIYYKIRYFDSKLKIDGIGILRLKIDGNVSLKIKSGYIVKSKIVAIGKNNCLIFDDDVKISNCELFIRGNNCTVHLKGNRNMSNTHFVLKDDSTTLKVEKNTGFNHDKIVVEGINNIVTIGSDCIFAEDVGIWSSDTHSILNTETDERINPDLPIHIGDRVWFGNRALIHKGVNIGNDVVIGAGSIVIKDIPNNSLVAGVPAKIIKTDIKWNINRL